MHIHTQANETYAHVELHFTLEKIPISNIAVQSLTWSQNTKNSAQIMRTCVLIIRNRKRGKIMTTE